MTARATIEIGKQIQNPKYGSYHIIGDGGILNGRHMVIIRFDKENMFPGRTTEHMDNGHTILYASMANVNNPNHNVIDPYQLYPFYLYGYGCRGFVDDVVSDVHKRESDIWRNRIAKIANPNHQQYAGPGVSMWYEWRCFEYFSRDIKYIPGYNLWLENQGEYDLDKDVKYGFIPITQRQRIYSPDTCLFVTHTVNMAQAAFDRTYPYGLPEGKYIGVSVVDAGHYMVTFMGQSRGRFTNPIAAASCYNVFARYNGYPPHLMNNLGNLEMSMLEISRNRLNETKIDGTDNYKMFDLLDK